MAMAEMGLEEYTAAFLLLQIPEGIRIRLSSKEVLEVLRIHGIRRAKMAKKKLQEVPLFNPLRSTLECQIEEVPIDDVAGDLAAMDWLDGEIVDVATLHPPCN